MTESQRAATHLDLRQQQSRSPTLSHGGGRFKGVMNTSSCKFLEPDCELELRLVTARQEVLLLPNCQCNARGQLERIPDICAEPLSASGVPICLSRTGRRMLQAAESGYDIPDA